MGYFVAGAILIGIVLWGLSESRGLSAEERTALAEHNLFAQAPGSRSPTDPSAAWYDPRLVLQPALAVRVLGADRARELEKRGWRFWGKAA